MKTDTTTYATQLNSTSTEINKTQFNEDVSPIPSNPSVDAKELIDHGNPESHLGTRTRIEISEIFLKEDPAETTNLSLNQESQDSTIDMAEYIEQAEILEREEIEFILNEEEQVEENQEKEDAERNIIELFEAEEYREASTSSTTKKEESNQESTDWKDQQEDTASLSASEESDGDPNAWQMKKAKKRAASKSKKKTSKFKKQNHQIGKA